MPDPIDLSVMPDYYVPGQHYYDRRGRPISLMDWAKQREGSNRWSLNDQTRNGLLRTVYLGFVDEMTYDARLFGTALMAGRARQIEVHDTEEQARRRHQDHLDAIAAGHHCARCKDGLDHIA